MKQVSTLHQKKIQKQTHCHCCCRLLDALADSIVRQMLEAASVAVVVNTDGANAWAIVHTPARMNAYAIVRAVQQCSA